MRLLTDVLKAAMTDAKSTFHIGTACFFALMAAVAMIEQKNFAATFLGLGTAVAWIHSRLGKKGLLD